MPQFLDTKGILYYTNEIFKKAQKEIGIVTPFVQLGQNIYERLADANERGVPIFFVHGKEKMNKIDSDGLIGLDLLSLFFYENLHAKCFFNEHQMIIGSMNLYEYSARNREMGVLVESSERVYQEARIEVESIINAAQPIRVARPQAKRHTDSGYCIRCGTSIEFNPMAPLCYSCFQVWAEWQNPDFEENQCHGCGRRVRVSKRNAMCGTCW